MNDFNKQHPLIIIFIAFSIMIPIMISTNLKIILIYGLIGILYLFLFKIKLKIFLPLIFIIIPITISILFLNMFYPNLAKIDTSKHFTFLNYTIYQDAFYTGLRLFARYYLLTLLSISTVTLIDFYKLIFSFIQQFRLSANYGYPAFIAINAIKHAKDEYQRIRTVKKMRNIKGLNIFTISIPLLVYAIRFSERSSIALLSKGYTKDKIYYFNYKLNNKSLKLTILFFFLNIGYFLFLSIF